MREIFVFPLIAIAFLSACNESSTTSTKNYPPMPAVPPPSIDTAKSQKDVKTLIIQTASPDQSVKSWWRYLDLIEDESFESCKKRQAQEKPSYLIYLPKLADGDLLVAREPQVHSCVLTTLSREIDEVKTESETRAIVFATIKNITPIPAGAEPDEMDKNWRSLGFKFKYLVEKIEGNWKVAQVYRYDETNKILKKDVWEKIYKPSNKPHVPAYVGFQ